MARLFAILFPFFSSALSPSRGSDDEPMKKSYDDIKGARTTPRNVMSLELFSCHTVLMELCLLYF